MVPATASLPQTATNSHSRGKELTPYQRGQICGMRAQGASYSEISKDLGIPRSTVRSTIDREPPRQQGATKPRPGRPLITNERDKRAILRYIKQRPKATYAQVRSETGIDISDSTLKRILRKCNLKRPSLQKIEAKTGTGTS